MLTQAVVGRLDRGKVSAVAVYGNAHTQLRQACIIVQLRVAVGHQHQRHAQVLGDLFEVVEITDANHAQRVGAGILIGHGAGNHFFDRDQRGVGPGDDRQLRIDARLQGRTDLANAFGNADQVGGLASELGGQQGVFNRQRSDTGTLQLGDGTHDVQGVAVAVVGVGNHRQLRHPANTRGLLGKLAEGDQGKIRCSQHLQGSDRTTQNTYLETQVGGDTRRHRVKHGSRVVTGRGSKELTKRATQVLVGGSWHGLSNLSTSFIRQNIPLQALSPTESDTRLFAAQVRCCARFSVSLGNSLNNCW
ncbi:hypothetical protein D3C84_701010 [compost metagenome]